MILPILLLLAQVGPKTPADAKPVAVNTERRVLKVGETIVSPIKKATVACVNRAVIQATPVDGRFELKGLAPGDTQCTFSGSGPTVTIDFTVARPAHPDR